MDKGLSFGSESFHYCPFRKSQSQGRWPRSVTFGSCGSCVVDSKFESLDDFIPGMASTTQAWYKQRAMKYWLEFDLDYPKLLLAVARNLNPEAP
jgi:hypothetical protein